MFLFVLKLKLEIKHISVFRGILTRQTRIDWSLLWTCGRGNIYKVLQAARWHGDDALFNRMLDAESLLAKCSVGGITLSTQNCAQAGNG